MSVWFGALVSLGDLVSHLVRMGKLNWAGPGARRLLSFSDKKLQNSLQDAFEKLLAEDILPVIFQCLEKAGLPNDEDRNRARGCILRRQTLRGLSSLFLVHKPAVEMDRDRGSSACATNCVHGFSKVAATGTRQFAVLQNDP